MKFKTPEETQRQDLLRAAGTPLTQSCNRPSLGAPTPVAGGVAPGSLWGEGHKVDPRGGFLQQASGRG